MEGCEAWMEDPESMRKRVSALWGQLPYHVNRKILLACGFVPLNRKEEGAWRLKVIAFIRGTYAP